MRVRHHPDGVDLGRQRGRSARRMGDFEGLGLDKAVAKLAAKQQRQQQLLLQAASCGKPAFSPSRGSRAGRKANRGGFGLRVPVSTVPFSTAKQ